MNTIARTILEQIGGKRFAVMTGSRDFVDMGNGLRMSLARNKTSANRLDIIYDAGTDLYNMRFFRKTFSKKTFESKAMDVAQLQRQKLFSINFRPDFGPPFLQLTEPQ